MEVPTCDSYNLEYPGMHTANLGQLFQTAEFLSRLNPSPAQPGTVLTSDIKQVQGAASVSVVKSDSESVSRDGSEPVSASLPLLGQLCGEDSKSSSDNASDTNITDMQVRTLFSNKRDTNKLIKTCILNQKTFCFHRATIGNYRVLI